PPRPGAPGPLADDARVRRRPADARAPADRDRALRQLERCEARGRPRPAALRDARGAAPGPPRPRRRAREDANSARPRGTPRPPSFEVALLAHVRLADDRAPRGRL